MVFCIRGHFESDSVGAPEWFSHLERISKASSAGAPEGYLSRGGKRRSSQTQVAISFCMNFPIPVLLNGETFRKLIAHGVCHLYASGVIPRSGATVFLTFIARLGCSPARAPPCLSDTKGAWSARPLGRHRVFRAPSTPGAHPRSGATVFLIHRKRLRCSAARAPPCFFTHQVGTWRSVARAPPCF